MRYIDVVIDWISGMEKGSTFSSNDCSRMLASLDRKPCTATTIKSLRMAERYGFIKEDGVQVERVRGQAPIRWRVLR